MQQFTELAQQDADARVPGDIAWDTHGRVHGAFQLALTELGKCESSGNNPAVALHCGAQQ